MVELDKTVLMVSAQEVQAELNRESEYPSPQVSVAVETITIAEVWKGLDQVGYAAWSFRLLEID